MRELVETEVAYVEHLKTIVQVPPQSTPPQFLLPVSSSRGALN